MTIWRGAVISEEGILLTGRLFERGDNIGCFVSDLIQTEEQYEEVASELIFGDLYDGFVEYYPYLKSVIHCKVDSVSYGDNLRGTHRIPYAYMEQLQELEKIVEVSFSKEIERCFYDNEEPTELPYSERVKEYEEYLFKIESSRVNTMEMLFEAEEMEQLASETEKKNDEMIQNTEAVDHNTIDEETKALLDDPESMIKILKKKRGI